MRSASSSTSALAGRVPFEADTYMGVLTKHMFATPEPIERVVPDASSLGALGPIAMRCLAKSPHDRYPSMAEVVAAIELALADAGIVRPGALRSERPRARIGARGDSERPIATPGLKPMVGPVGLGVAVVLLAGVLLLLGVRGVRGSSNDGLATAGSARPATSAEGAALPEAATAAPITRASAGAVSVPVALTVATPVPQVPPPPVTPPVTTGPTRSGNNTKGVKPRSGGRPGGDVVDPWGNK